jgi:hypothetical protein
MGGVISLDAPNLRKFTQYWVEILQVSNDSSAVTGPDAIGNTLTQKISSLEISSYQPTFKSSNKTKYSFKFASADEDLGEIVTIKSTSGIISAGKSCLFEGGTNLSMEEDDTSKVILLNSNQNKISSKWKEELTKQFRGVLPVARVQWEELQSDEALKKMAFCGIGQLYIQGEYLLIVS